MADVVGYVKEHPYQVGAIAVIGVIAVYFVLSGGSSGTPASSGGVDTATLALEQHQQDLQAAAQAQQQTLSAQLAGLQQQGANEIAIATIQAQSQGELAKTAAQTQITHDTLAEALGVQQIQGQLDQAKLQADVANNTINTQGMVQIAQTTAGLEAARINANTSISNTASTNAAEVAISGINAQTQQYVAQVVGTTQQQISTNQAEVAIEQTRANVEIAKVAAGAQKTSGILGLVGGIVGALL